MAATASLVLALIAPHWGKTPLHLHSALDPRIRPYAAGSLTNSASISTNASNSAPTTEAGAFARALVGMRAKLFANSTGRARDSYGKTKEED